MDISAAGGGFLEYRASLLAGKGFAVLALAYYNYEDLPKTLRHVHLEYFEEAVNYLLNHPQVGTSLVSCASPSLAVKNVINLILVLTIW